MITARSKRVNSAENALKKSIHHFYLVDFNFPSEAVDCVIQLHLALELLVKEKYRQDQKKIPDKVSQLFQEFWKEDESKKESAEWLRRRRNKLHHEGEAFWEERNDLKISLLNGYSVAGQTYESLGCKIESVFNRGEQSILRGEEADWKDRASILVDASLQLYKEDSDIAIDVSNGALELAIRGFANSWRLNEADSLPVPDLIEALEANEYSFVSDIPISFDDWFSRPIFFTRDTHDECCLDKNCMDHILRVKEDADHQPDRFNEIFKNGLEDTRDVVISLIKDAPYLDYFENLVNNWSKIVDQFALRAPGIKIPSFTDEFGISCSWYDGKYIWIHFSGSQDESGWTDHQIDLFMYIIELLCGKIPYDLNVHIIWEFPRFSNRSKVTIIE